MYACVKNKNKTYKYINYVMCFCKNKNKTETYKFRNLYSLMSHNLTLCSNIVSHYSQYT